jgi:ATPases of the AAA+ class
MGKNKKKKESSKQRLSSFATMSSDVSQVSKLAFMILSLGGYLNASTYSDFLDIFPEEDEIHEESDMDDIMNAMEFHEQHRIKLAKVLRLLVSAMGDYISIENKPGDVEADLLYFQNVDRCLSDTVAEISLYKNLMLKQEEVILNLRRGMKNICKRNHPDLIPFLRYVWVFEELTKQYMRQIQWENECLNNINKKLQDGSVYIPLYKDEELRKAGLHLQRNLKVWADGIEKCAKLDSELWLDVEKNILEQFMHWGVSLGDRGVTEDSTLTIDTPDENVTQCKTFHDTAMDYCPSHTIEDCIKDFNSVSSVVDVFLSMEEHLVDGVVFGKPLLLLLTGPSGTGKTYLCNEIESRIAKYNNDSNESSVVGKFVSMYQTRCSIKLCVLTSDYISVISPRFPTDFVKPFVGGFEDSLLSLFSYAKSIATFKKCVLLLDGMDEFFTESVKNTTDSTQDNLRRCHLSIRTRSLFFDILDKLRRCENNQQYCNLSNLVVICTSKTVGDNVRDRFHKVFHLGEPNEIERKMILENCLQKPHGELTGDVRFKLEELVVDTVGKSRGDLAQYCRDAMDVVPRIDDSLKAFSFRLDVVKKSVTTILPESIKNISGEGFVDMKVSSAMELRREMAFDENGKLVFPLFGDNAKFCWLQLQNLIVSPLCHKKKLDRLLYGDDYHLCVGGERNPGNAGVWFLGLREQGNQLWLDFVQRMLLVLMLILGSLKFRVRP